MLMKKTLTWVAVAAIILVVYLIAVKSLILPWVGDQVAAIMVGTIGLVSGLFLKKKRSA